MDWMDVLFRVLLTWNPGLAAPLGLSDLWEITSVSLNFLISKSGLSWAVVVRIVRIRKKVCLLVYSTAAIISLRDIAQQ